MLFSWVTLGGDKLQLCEGGGGGGEKGQLYTKAGHTNALEL